MKTCTPGIIIALLLLFTLTSTLVIGQDNIERALADSISKETPAPPSAKMQENGASSRNTEISMEIDGLLVDETKTKAGRDFYDYLYSKWDAPPGVSNYNIKVSEKPYRVNLTLLEIYVNDEMVINTILQPRQQIIMDLAEQVAIGLGQYLLQLSETIKQLEDEDQSGSGIF